MRAKKRQQKKRALQAIYEKVPKIACKGLCHDSCGPIGMSLLEAEILEARLGHALPKSEGIDCPFLTAENRCAVYEQRPMVCRLWGSTENLSCPHGCEREGSLTYGEGIALLSEVADLSGGEFVLLYPPGWKDSLATLRERSGR